MPLKFKFKTKDGILTGHHRVRSGGAMTALLAIVALTAILAGGFLLAQSPPLPSAPELRPVKVVWDPQPASEYYNAVDTNGNHVGITYRVYNATNVTGPWTVAATTTNLSTTISNRYEPGTWVTE